MQFNFFSSVYLQENLPRKSTWPNYAYIHMKSCVVQGMITES